LCGDARHEKKEGKKQKKKKKEEEEEKLKRHMCGPCKPISSL
jgi:hypothetical protein